MESQFQKYKSELLKAYTAELRPTSNLELSLIEQMAVNHAHFRCFSDQPAVIPDDPTQAEKQFERRARLALRFQAKMQSTYRQLLADRRRAAREEKQSGTPIPTKPVPSAEPPEHHFSEAQRYAELAALMSPNHRESRRKPQRR
jgi:hypothetical protein